MTDTPQRNLRMFSRLCGGMAASTFRLVTTRWDMEDEVLDIKGRTWAEVFEEREKQLRERYWKEMLDNQATICRYSNETTAAWAAIQPLLSQEQERPRLRLNEKKAGKLAHENIHGFLDMERQKIKIMKKRAAVNPDLLKQIEVIGVIEREYNALLAEAEKEKIGFVRKVMLMLQKKRTVCSMSSASFLV